MKGTTVREVKPEDIGWLAGIIDGEGSITFSMNGRGFLMHMIHIIGSDMELLKKCVRIINAYKDEGVEAKILDKKYKNGLFKSNKRMYRIEVWRQGHLKNLLPVLIPHLTEKKIKCQQLLNYLQNHKKGTWLTKEEKLKFLDFTPAETKRTAPMTVG
jgi:hypothetical protein